MIIASITTIQTLPIGSSIQVITLDKDQEGIFFLILIFIIYKEKVGILQEEKNYFNHTCPHTYT